MHRDEQALPTAPHRATSVNEALARGLHQRVVADIEAAELASSALIRKSMRCTAPATRKGMRRFFDEQTRIVRKLLLTPPVDPVAERYGVWLAWHVYGKQVPAGRQPGEVAVVAYVVDLRVGLARMIEMPFICRKHLIVRAFQRLGTTDPSCVMTELRDAMLWATALGIGVRHLQMMPPEQQLTKVIPFLLPTPTGAICGDLTPEYPHLRLNTYIGGRRLLTDAKSLLRGEMANVLDAYSEAEMAQLISAYFGGVFSGALAGGGRIAQEYEHALRRSLELLKGSVMTLHRFRYVLQDKAVREDNMVRQDLAWRWAQMQHLEQQEEIMA